MGKSSVAEAADTLAAELQALALHGGLRTWRLRGRELLPVVRGRAARARSTTPWLDIYLCLEPRLKAVAHVKKKCNMAFDCLAHCGLRDGIRPALI